MNEWKSYTRMKGREKYMYLRLSAFYFRCSKAIFFNDDYWEDNVVRLRSYEVEYFDR